MTKKTEGLEQALAAIEDRADEATWARSGDPYGIVFPLIRYGARVGLREDEEEFDEVMAIVEELRGAEEEAPDLYETGLSEYHMELLEPSEDWSVPEQAIFWRVKGKAFAASLSDFGLNLTASALERALPWHIENEPALALDLIGRRARAMSYASYGGDDVFAQIDEAFEIYEDVELEPAEELRFILQVCEVLDRHAAVTEDSLHRAERLLRLSLRGLALVDETGDDGQVSRLHHGLADALFRGPEDVADSFEEELYERYKASTVAEIPKIAWMRAIDAEVGDFYGEVTAQRKENRIEQYEGRLGLVAISDGDVQAAVEFLDRPGQGLYRNEQNLKKVLKILLGHDEADVDDCVGFLTRAFRRDVLDAEKESHWWDPSRALEYSEYVFHHLWSMGASDEVRDGLLEAMRAEPWYAEAAEKLERTREESRARAAKHAARLMDAFSRSWGAPADPPEETPRLRMLRALTDAPRDVLQGTGTEFLIYDLFAKSEDEDLTKVSITAKVNAPAYAFEQVMSSAPVRDALGEIEARLRAAGTDGELEISWDFERRPLDSGMGAPEYFAVGLKIAGVTDLLRVFGLEEAAEAATAEGSPEEVVERRRALQEERRNSAMMRYY